jgi:C1A family cysteine protease
MKLHKKSLAGSLAFLLLAVSAITFAQGASFSTLDSELADLNSAIAGQGAEWTAGETSLSRLPPDELQKRVGTTKLSITAKAVPEKMGIADALPSSLDWRNHDGHFVSAIKDQGQCGSCWAFAMTAGLESNALLTHSASAKVSYSEQVLISCGGVGSCDGGTLNADFLTTMGLPPTKYYPYTASDGVCSKAGKNWQKATYKIGDWGTVSQNLSSIKAALAKYGPLPTTFIVHEDFKHYKSGVYSYVSGKELGGHAVLLVGYNDDKKYFIIKNSWGTDWGESGYFRISYSEMDPKKSDFGMDTIAYQPAGTEPPSSGLVKNGAGPSADISQKIEPLLEQRPL